MSKILQFKITLNRSDPKIWRRFQIEDVLKFHDLHLVIQHVMGWTNSHLHEFRYQRSITIGDPGLLDRKDIEDENKIKLSKILSKPGIALQYEYDFGDSWIHELKVEKILDKASKQYYPFCLEGEKNCPPEDCGGIPGFYSYLEILKDENHPEYEEVKEWMGDYDANEFDLFSINESLKDYKAIELDFE